jgi:hypothetical protein
MEEDGLIANACRALGLEKQDDWPVAPRLARAAGVEPENAYWLCADPASFTVGAADVRLASLVDDLAPDDARTLVATLNAHFAADGIAFVAPTPSKWFVRAADRQHLSTRPPDAAHGRPLFAFLPSGPDAGRWRRWLNELQMLFFDHAVNRKREREGRVAVDSAWLWGGGIDTPAARAATAIFARDPRVVALARGSAAELRAPPASFAALERFGSAAVWLDALDADRASEALPQIEQAWAAPLEQALRRGRVASLEIVAAGRDQASRFQPKRSSLAQRWRARWSRPRGSRILAEMAREMGAQ